MTFYQQLKNGKAILIEPWADNTHGSAPSLFYYFNGAIWCRNPEIGFAHGYLNGKQFNAHCHRMLKRGFAVETYSNYERGVDMYGRAAHYYITLPDC